MSGRYASSHRATNNETHLQGHVQPTFGGHFHGAGYYTHMIGKCHFASCTHPTSPEAVPFIHNTEFYRSWRGPFYGFQHADLHIGHTTEKHSAGMHYRAWLEDQGVDIDKYFGNTEYFDWGAWELPEAYHPSRWTADRTIDAIHKASNEGRPFCLWSNFQDPHNPYFVPEPWASMYNPDEVSTPGFKPGEPEVSRKMKRRAPLAAAILVAVIAGWITTEVGRQPYVIYGLMRTHDAASPASAGEVAASLIAFIIVYFIVFGAGTLYILREMGKRPGDVSAPSSKRPRHAAGITPGAAEGPDFERRGEAEDTP